MNVLAADFVGVVGYCRVVDFIIAAAVVVGVTDLEEGAIAEAAPPVVVATDLPETEGRGGRSGGGRCCCSSSGILVGFDGETF